MKPTRYKFNCEPALEREEGTNRLDEYIKKYHIQLDTETRRFYDNFVCTSNTRVYVSETANAIVADNSRFGRMNVLFVGFDGKCSIAVGYNM